MGNRVTQRFFGNNVYFLFDWCQTKREAIKEANQLRAGKHKSPSSGRAKWYVRIIPAGDGYQIWRR